MLIFWEVINIFRDFGSSFHFYIWNQLDIFLFSDTESQLIKEKVYDNETFLFRCLFEIWKHTWSILKIIYLYLLLDTLWLSFFFYTLLHTNCGFFCSNGTFISIFSSVRKVQNVGRCWATETIILIYLALNRLLLRNIWLLFHIFHSHSKSIRSAISSNLTEKCKFMIHNWK